MTHDSMTSNQIPWKKLQLLGGHRPFDRRTDGRRFLGVRVGEEDSLPGGSRNRKKRNKWPVAAGWWLVVLVNGCWGVWLFWWLVVGVNKIPF